jgi:FkbM family methyltransferase
MRPREHAPLWRRALRQAGRIAFRLAENNDDPRMECNGEEWLLRELLSAHGARRTGRPFVVIDGGANRGDYSRGVRRLAAAAGVEADVHAFEPSPACVERLQADFAGVPAIRIVGCALSDRAGTAVLHDGRGGSSQASLVRREVHGREPAGAVAVPTIRLGDYLEGGAIKRVDLLKLDVEGHELAALRGTGASLHPDTVDVIQFEYGGAALDAGTTLRQLYDLLSGRGYVVAKLFPAALEARDYRPWMEHYAFANYVALAPRWRSNRLAT